MRNLDIVVISDVHLGTYGCMANELLDYLHSIQTKTLILNGDFVDIWEFDKDYFPKAHLQVIKKVVDFSTKGCKVIYITGNHDELLRKFTDFNLGDFQLTNKKLLTINDKTIWIFHGDVFDASVQHSKWIAKLGGYGYDFLIRLNAITNWILQKFGKEKYSFSKKIKASVKNAVKYIGDFEKTAAELAIDKGYDFVICGHIHQPQMRQVTVNGKSTMYLNSGDWLENGTSLEFSDNQWKLFTYNEKDFENSHYISEEDKDNLSALNDLIKNITSEK